MADFEFRRMNNEELDEAIEMLVLLSAKLVADEQLDDGRKARERLNAKYLARTDVIRARQSLAEYRELLPD